jgi:hypothetical protein
MGTSENWFPFLLKVIYTMECFTTICHNNKYKNVVLSMSEMVRPSRRSIPMPLNEQFTTCIDNSRSPTIYVSTIEKGGHTYIYSCEEERFTDYFYTKQQLRDKNLTTLLDD